MLFRSLFGIVPELDGLKIDPCLPEHLKEFTATRNFRDVRYNIVAKKYTNDKKGLFVNGKLQKDNVIPYSNKNKNVLIELYY